MAEERDSHPGANLRITVVYATQYAVDQVALSLPSGATVRTAVERSGVLQTHPELGASALELGIYGMRVGLDRLLCDQDRIEIYRPLTVDPKEGRRRKAAKRRLSRGMRPARCARP